MKIHLILVTKLVTLTFDEEHLLEVLWINLIEGKKSNCSLEDLIIEPNIEDFDFKNALHSLLRRKAIALMGENKKVILTPEGHYLAEEVIRRHRLSERLFKDIFQARNEEIEGTSCKFEHLLTPGIEENVCTLLGHPTHCPHGRPIPPGSCCKERRFHTNSAILPLSDLPKGMEGEIAYISTGKPKRLNKLLSSGLLPGTRIKIEKKSPVLILKLDETILVLDKTIAGDIFCRCANGKLSVF